MSGGTLHVTNGDSTGDTLGRTTLGGTVLAWQDTLHEGPVPYVPVAELRVLRAAFLSGCGWGSEAAIRSSLQRRDELLAGALEAHRSIVLWFEHDPHDQLQLLQILARVADAGCELEPIELVEVCSFEGRPDFRGLGELTASELETLWPDRRSLTPELVDVARLGWEAVCAPEPTAIEALLDGGVAERPFLETAFRRLLEELPDVTSGLSRSERQLLELLVDGPRSPGELFLESQRREEAPFEGDAWVWRRLASFGTGSEPLVALAGGGALPPPPPVGEAQPFVEATVALTAVGTAVVAGEVDLADLAGIDRWLGGTHLSPDELWRWDARAARVIAG